MNIEKAFNVATATIFGVFGVFAPVLAVIMGGVLQLPRLQKAPTNADTWPRRMLMWAGVGAVLGAVSAQGLNALDGRSYKDALVVNTGLLEHVLPPVEQGK